jgi:3-hydroxyisobutyrate dehydrogenase
MQKGSLCIDCSTINGEVAKAMNIAAIDYKAMYIDSPVSGGVGAATNGVLTFMVGGPGNSYEQAKPLLEKMGKNVFHCGDVGAGQATKICNNMLLAISMIGTSEILLLAQKLGLDPKMCSKVVNASSGRCWSSDTYNPCPGVLDGVPSSRDYEGGFGTALMRKDLNLAQNAAVSNKSITPMGSLALSIYNLMCQHGFEYKDFSSVYKFMEQKN